jgi:hypothetical protein
MDGREIEPRVLMWALAEISWEDPGGEQCQAAATLENTSTSGACVRLKRPLAVGCVVTIRWQREQFSAVARNCRRDGRDFLIGVRREAGNGTRAKNPPKFGPAATSKLPESTLSPVKDHPLLQALHAEGERRRMQEIAGPGHASTAALDQESRSAGEQNRIGTVSLETVDAAPLGVHLDTSLSTGISHDPGAPPRPERKDMEPKTLFPNFWHRGKGPDRLASDNSKEVVVNKAHESTAEPGSPGYHEMLSYEDIYHAAGILNPPSGYGIHKVLEMLNSERIRDWSKDVKRASVLMALDAAGTSMNDVLKDAMLREEALNRYEAGNKKRLEEFESAKAREIDQIEKEMERLRTHYAERIQRNRDVIAQEKEALRNWQMAMQHEMQRIAEVIELCGKQAPDLPHSTAPPRSRSTPGNISEASAESSRAAASGQGS